MRIVASQACELQCAKRVMSVAIASEHPNYDLIHRRPLSRPASFPRTKQLMSSCAVFDSLPRCSIRQMIFSNRRSRMMVLKGILSMSRFPQVATPTAIT
jgi:hypothetical protein